MPSLLATVATPSVAPGQYSATMYSQIVNVGGSLVSGMGFQVGMTTSYGVSDVYYVGSYGNGQNYSLSSTGLACGTMYHYRAYAHNAYGTAFSPDQTFVTGACPTPTPSGSPGAYYGGQSMVATVIEGLGEFVKQLFFW